VLVPALQTAQSFIRACERRGHFLVVRSPQRMSAACRFMSQRARQRKRERRWERWKNKNTQQSTAFETLT
jgi:hypothetical protein